MSETITDARRFRMLIEIDEIEAHAEGEVTLATLVVLGAYRRNLDSTEPPAFGIYGEAATPGTVRVGGAVRRVDG